MNIKLLIICALNFVICGCGNIRPNNQANNYPQSQSNYISPSDYNAQKLQRANSIVSSMRVNAIEGAKIIAPDGQFLGVVTNDRLNQNSIGNEIGNYGSRISSTSIFNEIGKYGGTISEFSPFNAISQTPPKIITQDGRWAYLTVNQIMSPRIDPHAVIAYAKNGL